VDTLLFDLSCSVILVILCYILLVEIAEGLGICFLDTTELLNNASTADDVFGFTSKR